MSFGELNNMINATIELINSYTDKTILNHDSLYALKHNVYKLLLSQFPQITINIVNDIFTKLFTTKYKFNKMITFDGGYNCLREYECIYDEVQVKPKYQKLENQFQKLLKLPQPAQRTKEWFDYRFNRITASDTASAIDQNPYQPVEEFILRKCDSDYLFKDNADVFHGKKYEPVATLIYEHIYNCRMFEFGALPSEKYNFLGASPDGICSKYTLDNKFCKRLGRMLEIKCPTRRMIINKGDIVGEICPYYYYCQIQQQLVCCELDFCDFWQCKLSEYKSKKEYMLDDCSDSNNSETVEGVKVEINPELKKGIILEFYPKVFIPQFDGDIIEWKSKYIYPKSLDMTTSQYDEWVLTMLEDYKSLYPDIAKDYYFNKIIYWKLDVSHNVCINRDDVFFKSILPILKDTWAKVQYYRKNKTELQKLRDIVKKRTTYRPMNTTFTIANSKILNDKFDFLNEKFDISTLLTDAKPKPKAKYYKQPSEEEFVDVVEDKPSNCDFID
jgi:putative phage-type endonuclease